MQMLHAFPVAQMCGAWLMVMALQNSYEMY
ncbi:hypothetical protein M233_07870 [Xylella fastidiosa subsp. multiplex Griffin-1]|nr:hypothetical protein M233_07870 [Xylella fastidiosa subsp. multiplex Griffin-1]